MRFFKICPSANNLEEFELINVRTHCALMCSGLIFETPSNKFMLSGGQKWGFSWYFFHQRYDQLWDGGGAGNRFQPQRVLPLHAHGDALGLCQPQDDAQ